MSKPVWMTLCDDGYVNIHRTMERPPVLQGTHGQYQDADDPSYMGAIPAAIAYALTGEKLAFYHPVRWERANVVKAHMDDLLADAEAQYQAESGIGSDRRW